MFEIDGPAMAWFESENGRHTYQTYAIGGTAPAELIQMAANHIKECQERGIIVWRRRPSLQFEQEHPGDSRIGLAPTVEHWKLTYRLAVIPYDEGIGVPFHKEEGEAVRLR
jgi:hypothetical protein